LRTVPFLFKKATPLIFKSILISVIREISDLIEKCGDGSSPSGAYGGGWEDLGEDGEDRRFCRLQFPG